MVDTRDEDVTRVLAERLTPRAGSNESWIALLVRQRGPQALAYAVERFGSSATKRFWMAPMRSI